MELINPHLIINNSINDDYYCEKFLEGLELVLPKYIKEIYIHDNIMDFPCTITKVTIRIDSNKPINYDSLELKLSEIIKDKYSNYFYLHSLDTNPSDFLNVGLVVVDPYRLVYELYYEYFKKELTAVINTMVITTSSNTNYKYIELILKESPTKIENSIFYLLKMLAEIFENNHNYKAIVSYDEEEKHNKFIIYWGEGEFGDKSYKKETPTIQDNKEKEPLPFDYQEEPKSLSFMDRLRNYAKRLVEYQRNNYD